MTWNRFKKYYLQHEKLGFSLDVSRMDFEDDFLIGIEPKMNEAIKAMKALENGAIANPDEGRMVGHYWLRAPELAPDIKITESIISALGLVKSFALKIHEGSIQGATGVFKNLLLIGIGGSALGPQFVAQALGQGKKDKMKPFFLDNTDPDGIDIVLSSLEGQLGQTLCVVISKSGGTAETRNGMLETEYAYSLAGLKFADHAVAVTGENSKLDKKAVEDSWIQRFPMWDWVGGRTSETATVGLLPAALQGLDIDHFLEGAALMDVATRVRDMKKNPATLLAAMWFYATKGKGSKDMVILPYKDRLGLFSKYLQQLVMESLGKEYDLEKNVVNQGITVYGNKGSTDQHAYVQQLREGVLNFFITFIEVLKDRNGKSIEIEGEPLTTSGDFLLGFLLGSRDALYEKGRESITITVEEINPATIGALIALYERAVGLYASLVGINAYHQPGVEAGKKAAKRFLSLNHLLISYLQDYPGSCFTVDELAKALGLKDQNEIIFKLLEHLSANEEKGIVKTNGSSNVFSARYCYQKQDCC